MTVGSSRQRNLQAVFSFLLMKHNKERVRKGKFSKDHTQSQNAREYAFRTPMALVESYDKQLLSHSFHGLCVHTSTDGEGSFSFSFPFCGYGPTYTIPSQNAIEYEGCKLAYPEMASSRRKFFFFFFFFDCQVNSR